MMPGYDEEGPAALTMIEQRLANIERAQTEQVRLQASLDANLATLASHVEAQNGRVSEHDDELEQVRLDLAIQREKRQAEGLMRSRDVKIFGLAIAVLAIAVPFLQAAAFPPG